MLGIPGTHAPTGHCGYVREIGMLRTREHSSRSRQHTGIVHVHVKLAGRDGVEPGVAGRTVQLEPERVRDTAGNAVDVDLADRAVGQFDCQQGDVVCINDAFLRRSQVSGGG